MQPTQTSQSTINPRADGQRTLLRTAGLVLTAVGAVFMVIFITDFLGMAENPGHGFPSRIWCMFVGVPLVGIGLALLKVGFLGPVARYVAGEVVPVAKDSLEALSPERGDARQRLQQLQQLEQLHRDGLIRDDEYTAQRQRILAEL